MAGDVCVSLQAPPPKVATQDSGGRDGLRRIDGDARTKRRVRAQTPRRSHHPEVAPDVAILRRAQNRYVASDALASMTEATRQHRSVSRRTRRSRFAQTPGHPSRDVFRQAVSRTANRDSAASRGGATSLRPSWGRPILLSSVLRRPRSSKDSLRLLHPLRLDGAHEAIRVDFALFSTSTCLKACQSHVAAYV